MTQHLTDVKVLAFDVFDTVVDWRSSITAEGDQLGKAKGISVDWATFADSWRSIYHPFMDRVRSGQLPWTNLDGLHRQTLDETLTKSGIDTLTNDEKDNFTRVWHRLKPWPDFVPGLQRLKSRFVITTLSNGNISLQTNMAKFAGLPWEGVLSLPERRGLEFVIAEVAKTDDKAAGATPESLKLVEPTFLDEIKRSGFMDRLK